MKQLSIIALSLLAVAGGGCGGTSPETKQARESCFLTGGAQKLCGASVAAYCGLHYLSYLQFDQLSSAAACDTIAPGRHCREVATHNEVVADSSHDSQGSAVVGNPQAAYREPGCPAKVGGPEKTKTSTEANYAEAAAVRDYEASTRGSEANDALKLAEAGAGERAQETTEKHQRREERANTARSEFEHAAAEAKAYDLARD